MGRKNTEFVGLNPLFSSQPLPQDPFRVHPFLEDQLRGKKMKATATAEGNVEGPGPKAIGPKNGNRSVTNQVSFLKPESSNRFNSKGQRLCCQIMEEIYGQKFSCARPSWLKNPETGGILEIDCYNDKLKIGVEYNGIQHYVYPNVYHKSLVEFKHQVRRDQFKLKKCEENGVYLITVPYNVPHHKMKEYIVNQLPKDDESEEEYNDDHNTDDFTDLENVISMLDDQTDSNQTNIKSSKQGVNIPSTVCYQEYLA